MHGHVYVKIVMYAVLINYILFVAIVANAWEGQIPDWQRGKHLLLAEYVVLVSIIKVFRRPLTVLANMALWMFVDIIVGSSYEPWQKLAVQSVFKPYNNSNRPASNLNLRTVIIIKMSVCN